MEESMKFFNFTILCLLTMSLSLGAVQNSMTYEKWEALTNAYNQKMNQSKALEAQRQPQARDDTRKYITSDSSGPRFGTAGIMSEKLSNVLEQQEATQKAQVLLQQQAQMQATMDALKSDENERQALASQGSSGSVETYADNDLVSWMELKFPMFFNTSIEQITDIIFLFVKYDNTLHALLKMINGGVVQNENGEWVSNPRLAMHQLVGRKADDRKDDFDTIQLGRKVRLIKRKINLLANYFACDVNGCNTTPFSEEELKTFVQEARDILAEKKTWEDVGVATGVLAGTAALSVGMYYGTDYLARGGATSLINGASNLASYVSSMLPTASTIASTATNNWNYLANMIPSSVTSLFNS